MTDRDTKLFNLLLKLGISSKRLLDDAKRIVEKLHETKGEARIKYFHQLILLGSHRQRDPEDFFLLSQAQQIVEKVDFLRERGYKQIAEDLEQEAWNIIFSLALKWGPSFSRRLFLSDELLKEKEEEVEEL